MRRGTTNGRGGTTGSRAAHVGFPLAVVAVVVVGIAGVAAVGLLSADVRSDASAATSLAPPSSAVLQEVSSGLATMPSQYAARYVEHRLWEDRLWLGPADRAAVEACISRVLHGEIAQVLSRFNDDLAAGVAVADVQDAVFAAAVLRADLTRCAP